MFSQFNQQTEIDYQQMTTQFINQLDLTDNQLLLTYLESDIKIQATFLRACDT